MTRDDKAAEGWVMLFSIGLVVAFAGAWRLWGWGAAAFGFGVTLMIALVALAFAVNRSQP